MSSWSQSKAITKQSWSVVKANPYMFAFPVVSAGLSTIAVLIVAGIGLGILGVTGAAKEINSGGQLSTGTMIVGVIVLVLAAYVGTLIVQLFMGGLVASADEELQGRDSSFGAGLRRSFSRFGAICGWAGIQTAVGWLLSAVQGNGSGGNALVSILRAVLGSLMAVAWSILTFFVLPLIILRGLGPLAAIKQSFNLIKSTWGTSLAGGVRIGGIITLLGVLPAILLLFGGGLLAAAGNAAAGVPLLFLGVIVLIVAIVLVSALRAVFSVALLHYAEGGTALGPYGAAELHAAVRVKG